MFRLSERQAVALANMESYVGIRAPRTDFPDREAFQAYWDLVSKRGDATTRSRTGETTKSRAEKQQRHDQRITAYYQTPAHLLAYGQQYAQRYQPSSAKLRQQVMLKSGDAALVDQVMEQLVHRLDDHARASELADILQHKGSHAQAIRSKLRQRLFSTEVIEQCLTSMTSMTSMTGVATGSLLDADALTRKVHRLQRKGLSQRAMRSKLMGSSADSVMVQTTLNHTLGETGDDAALRIAIDRLARKQLDRRALIQRLIGKGFRYADVVRILAAAAEAGAGLESSATAGSISE